MFENYEHHSSSIPRSVSIHDVHRTGIWERRWKSSPTLIHIDGTQASSASAVGSEEFYIGVNANKRPHRVISSLRFRVARCFPLKRDRSPRLTDVRIQFSNKSRPFSGKLSGVMAGHPFYLCPNHFSNWGGKKYRWDNGKWQTLCDSLTFSE